MIVSPETQGPRLPRLHLVTNEQIIRATGFPRTAIDLVRAHGRRIALHLRGPTLSGRELYDAALNVTSEATAAGSVLVINDRADVALCCRAPALQLPGHSLDVRSARAVVGDATLVGRSVHSPEEGAKAVEDGADFLLAGTLFTTPSHPGREGAGTGWLSDLATLGRPVIAIGGIDADRAREVVNAGGYGVAVIRAVWGAEDPVAAAGQLLDALAAG